MNNTVMPSKLPFHKQETRYSCVPACLRMLFGSLGVDVPESELRERCDCTPAFGTDALMAVDVARQFGFAGTAKHNLTLDELQNLTIDGLSPIVFVNLEPIDGTEDIHALVVVGFTQRYVIILDPLRGERVLPLQSFNTAWGLRHNLAIIVKR